MPPKLLNIFFALLPNYFEFSRGDFMTLAILFGMYIYGHEVLEVYNPLEEKAAAEKGVVPKYIAAYLAVAGILVLPTMLWPNAM